MSALSSMEYPHWIIIAGVLLLMLGCAGLTLRQRTVGAEPLANTSDQEPSEPEADLNKVDAYNRMAKEKRRDSGKYHACIMPRETRPERKLEVHALFRERFVLGCSENHPFSG